MLTTGASADMYDTKKTLEGFSNVCRFLQRKIPAKTRLGPWNRLKIKPESQLEKACSRRECRSRRLDKFGRMKYVINVMIAKLRLLWQRQRRQRKHLKCVRLILLSESAK